MPYVGSHHEGPIDTSRYDQTPLIEKPQIGKTGTGRDAGGRDVKAPPGEKVISTAKQIKVVVTIAFATIALAAAAVPIALLSTPRIYRQFVSESGRAFSAGRKEMKQQMQTDRFNGFNKIAEKRQTVVEKCQLDTSSNKAGTMRQHIADIQEILDECKKDVGEAKDTKHTYRLANDAVIDHLLKAVESEDYKANKNSPEAKFLREMCAEMQRPTKAEGENPEKASVTFTKQIVDLAIKADYKPKGSNQTIKQMKEQLDAEAAKEKPVANTILMARYTKGLVEFSNREHYHNNGWGLDRFVHIYMHPMKTLQGIQSEHSVAKFWDKKGYAPQYTGNPVSRFNTLSVKFVGQTETHTLDHVNNGNTTITHLNGSKVNPLYKAAVEHLGDEEETFCLQGNLQSNTKHLEGERVDTMLKNQEQVGPNFHAFANNVDGKGFEGKNVEKYNASQYNDQISGQYLDSKNFTPDNYVGNPSGACYPPQSADDRPKERMDSACGRTGAMMIKTQNDKSEYSQNFQNLSPAHKARTHQYALQMVCTMGEMMLALKNNKKVAFQDACKEDIDRGATKNALEGLCEALMAGKPLTSELVNEIISPIMTRALASSDRAVVFHRLEPFLDLMMCVDPKDLQTAIQGHLADIKCVPDTVDVDFK